MPIKPCTKNGKPGFKYGDSGKCYTYTEGDTSGKQAARESARTQGVAIHISQQKSGKGE